ncbi:MAG: two-component system sensor histidine kinase NtrB [Candidatus Binatia bacterium]
MTQKRKVKNQTVERALPKHSGSAKLTSAERRQIRLDTIGRVAAALRHESRNLFGALGTCVQVLRRNPHLTTDDVELLDIMHSGANRFGEIIAQFAIFRHAEPPQFQTENLHVLIEETWTRLRGDERCSAQIVFERHFDPGIVLIQAARERLRQVLWELFLNAAQAMGNQGALEVETRRAGAAIHVTVRDSGPGIAAGTAQNIFEPLFTTKTRAAGLGLAIVKRVVEEHGGSVSVNSRPGKGASFTITLPAESSRGEQRATPSRARRRLKNGR